MVVLDVVAVFQRRSQKVTRRLAIMHVQYAVVGRPSSVTWYQTSLHTLLKDLRANYAACYSSKQDTASLSGWNGLFYLFLRCEENGTGLPECT